MCVSVRVYARGWLIGWFIVIIDSSTNRSRNCSIAPLNEDICLVKMRMFDSIQSETATFLSGSTPVCYSRTRRRPFRTG